MDEKLINEIRDVFFHFCNHVCSDSRESAALLTQIYFAEKRAKDIQTELISMRWSDEDQR